MLQLEGADVEGCALRAGDTTLVGCRTGGRGVERRAACDQRVGPGRAAVVGQRRIEDGGQRRGMCAVAGGDDVASGQREPEEGLRRGFPAVAEQVITQADGAILIPDFRRPVAGGIAGDQAAHKGQVALVGDAANIIGRVAGDGAAFKRCWHANRVMDAASIIGRVAADGAVVQRQRTLVADAATILGRVLPLTVLLLATPTDPL